MTDQVSPNSASSPSGELTTTKGEELLPCPFCGCEMIVANKTGIYCTGCEANIPRYLASDDTLLAWWNTRARSLPDAPESDGGKTKDLEGKEASTDNVELLRQNARYRHALEITLDLLPAIATGYDNIGNQGGAATIRSLIATVTRALK